MEDEVEREMIFSVKAGGGEGGEGGKEEKEGKEDMDLIWESMERWKVSPL